jgi:hypothetical protein
VRGATATYQSPRESKTVGKDNEFSTEKELLVRKLTLNPGSDDRASTAFMILFATLLLGNPLGAQAQDPEPEIIGPIYGRAFHHDVSQPLGEIATTERANPPGFEVEIPIGRRQDASPLNLPSQPDPLRQTEQRPIPGAASTPLPTMNFDGINNIDGVLPPDTQGDVGVDYYVQWVNLSWAIYDKATGAIATGCPAGPGGQCGPFAGNSFWSGFGGVCESTNNGDPIVLYDHLADRWLVSQFAVNQGTQCVALSQTGDPRGTYDRWAFVVSPGQQNDYPKLGVMPEAYYLTTRDFPSGSGTFDGFTALDRSAMLAGDPNAGFVKFGLQCLENNCPDGVQPPHLEGPQPPAGTPGIFTNIWDDDADGPWPGAGGADGYRLWEFDPDFADPGSSTFAELPFVPAGAAFDRTVFQIPQPTDNPICLEFGANCPTLDALTALQMYRAQLRHWGTYNTLVINNTVDATGSNVAGVRWAELRDTGPGGSWELYQDGTYAPADGENRWMGSLAMDAEGNIALGYSVSSLNTFPSIRYVTREAADPLGTLPGGEVELIAGSGTQTSSSNRWGDYSSMSIDPTDDCTFWYTQEYIQTTGGAPWRTRIGSFRIPSCSAASILVDPPGNDFGAFQVGSSSTALPVSITNDGSDPIDVTDLALSNSTDFLLDLNPSGDPCGSTSFTLPDGDSCNVEVTFNPQSQGAFSASLNVTTDDPEVSDKADLEGIGLNPCSADVVVLTNMSPETGMVEETACLRMEIGPYELGPAGSLSGAAGQSFILFNGTIFGGNVQLILAPSLLP